MFQEKGHTKLEIIFLTSYKKQNGAIATHNSAWMADIVHELMI